MFYPMEAVTSADDAKKIDFHVSVVKLTGRPFLQLVIVDKSQYSEYSTQIMQKLKNTDSFKKVLKGWYSECGKYMKV